MQINSSDPFDFSRNNIKKSSENIIIPDIVGPDNGTDIGSNSTTGSKSQSQSQSSAQPAHSSYHDNTTDNENPHNDEIIETDDKPGTELTFTNSQTDTPNSNNIINNNTNEESNEVVIEVEDQSSSIQSESEFTISAQSQSQSDAQPKFYNSYRDYMEKNNQTANADINVTGETQGVESSTSDSNIDTGNSSININKNANDINIIVPKDKSTTEDKSSTELSSSSTASPELSAQSSHEIYGDFNGDGFDDLAIGVPSEDVDTGAGTMGDAGAVNVLYGSSNGLSATSPPRPDQFWTQSTADVNDLSETGDLFGDSLSSGDFNGDGFDDLVIGVPSEDVDTGAGTITNAGAVNVLYGSSNGLSATSPPRPDQIWTQSTTDVNDVSEADDLFGASVSSGDFNGDGIDDIVIGVPFETGINDDAGAVNVLYGSSNGLSATSPRPDQFWTQRTADVNDLSETGDTFGASISSGDFNGDGFDDLVIGVPSEDVDTGAGTMGDAGAVNVLYGSSNGLSATSPPRPDQFWTQSTADVNDLSETGDLFGDSLSSGDFNGDGFDDLAIGVPLEAVDTGAGTIANAGAVNVLYGSSNGLSATSPPRPDQFWTQSTSDVNDLSETGDTFGASISSGDFNGDGFDDLAIGVSSEDVDTGAGTMDDAGAVNVLYGSSNGLSATSPPRPDQIWSQSTPNMNGGSEEFDIFGDSLSSGDFNGDGFDELAIGVPFEDVVVEQSDVLGAGAVNVLYGSSNGLSATSPPRPDQLWTQSTADVNDISEPDDNFGSALS